MFADAGANRVIFKRLAPNDNSKNQPYFGPDLTQLGFIPTGEITATKSSSSKPKKSSVKFLAELNFGWLLESGQVETAPHAKLIFYPQYPEVRFSGFLRGCKHAPNELLDFYRRGREPGRIMFLGISANGRITGYIADAESHISNEIRPPGKYAYVGVFEELSNELRRDRTVNEYVLEPESKLKPEPQPELALEPKHSLIHGQFGVADQMDLDFSEERDGARKLLLDRLGSIAAKGWINSRRLRADGTTIPYRAPNGGGFTLEAEFGITPNGYAQPDYLGWEIKQYTVRNLDRPSGGRITLMTPEPNGGVYKQDGVEPFLLRYGYPDLSGRDRLNFVGAHKCFVPHARTKLTLTLPGYDKNKRLLQDPTSGISLFDESGKCAASWSYSSVIAHWKKKHAKAAYIPSSRRTDPAAQYRFSPIIQLGEGTGFNKLLDALAKGLVIYDPGIIMYDASNTRRPIKRRSQFRISAPNLSCLYDDFVKIDLSDR